MKSELKKFLAAILALIGIVLFIPQNINAQSFGFDDYESAGNEGGVSGSPVKIGGEANAELKFFYDDFDAAETMRLGNVFSGKLNFSASCSIAEALVNLNIVPVFNDPTSIFSIDEAYLRAFLGPINITAGLRKLTWGKADSFGPLDVINPLDYSDLSGMSNPQNIKMARPLLHLAWNMGHFSKLEAVFVPWFEGHKFAGSGRWTPGQIKTLPVSIKAGLEAGISATPLAPYLPGVISPALNSWINTLDINDFLSGTYYSIKYAQAGMRFTTSFGPADFGIQYYFGRLPRPTYNINTDVFQQSLLALTVITLPTPDDVNPKLIKINVNYNPYHQIGIDYAQVIGGFNIRAEFGANITNDLKGTDGSVYNPSLVWSLGFDRNLFWGININLQGTESIRLLHKKIGANPMNDTEAGSDMTSTRITLVLSKTFLRDELEIKFTGLWGIEDRDFLVMPGINWSRNSLSAGLSAGFFLGDKSGELGQYRDNNYLKMTLGYKF